MDEVYKMRFNISLRKYAGFAGRNTCRPARKVAAELNVKQVLIFTFHLQLLLSTQLKCLFSIGIIFKDNCKMHVTNLVIMYVLGVKESKRTNEVIEDGKKKR